MNRAKLSKDGEFPRPFFCPNDSRRPTCRPAGVCHRPARQWRTRRCVRARRICGGPRTTRCSSAKACAASCSILSTHAASKEGDRGRQILGQSLRRRPAHLCASKAKTARRPAHCTGVASSRPGVADAFLGCDGTPRFFREAEGLLLGTGGAECRSSRRFALTIGWARALYVLGAPRGAPLRRRETWHGSCFLCPARLSVDSRMARSAEALKSEWLAALSHERRMSPHTLRAYGDDATRFLAFAQEAFWGALSMKKRSRG